MTTDWNIDRICGFHIFTHRDAIFRSHFAHGTIKFRKKLAETSSKLKICKSDEMAKANATETDEIFQIYNSLMLHITLQTLVLDLFISPFQIFIAKNIKLWKKPWEKCINIFCWRKSPKSIESSAQYYIPYELMDEAKCFATFIITFSETCSATKY